VDLDHAELHELHETFGGLDLQVGRRRATVLLVGDLDRAETARHGRARVLLEEHLALDAGRTAQHHDRPAFEVRQHAVGDHRVVACEVDLRELQGRVHDPIRMRDLDAEHRVLASRLRGTVARRRGIRNLAHDLRGGLVLAQTLERRMAQVAVARPLGEVDLGDERRLDPVGALRGIAGEGVLRDRKLGEP